MLYPLSYGRTLDDSDKVRVLSVELGRSEGITSETHPKPGCSQTQNSQLRTHNSLFAVGSGYTGLWAGGSRDRGNFSRMLKKSARGSRRGVVVGVERYVMSPATFNQERKNDIQDYLSHVG